MWRSCSRIWPTATLPASVSMTSLTRRSSGAVSRWMWPRLSSVSGRRTRLEPSMPTREARSFCLTPSPDSARWIRGAQLISDRPTAAICWSMVRRQRRDNMENRIPKRSRGEDEGMDNDLNSIEWNQIIPLMPGMDQRGTASSPPGTGTETGPDHHECHAQQCHQAYPQGHGGQRLFAEVGYDAQACIDRHQQCHCQQGELELNEP